MIKICTKCKKEFPANLTYFYKKGKYLYSWCKNCEKLRLKNFQEKNKTYFKDYWKKYQQENKEKVNKISKNWCKKNKEIKKNYREKNKEKIAQKHKKYQQENKEKVNKISRDWYQKNPKISKAKKAIRNNRILTAIPNDPKIKKQIKEIYKNCPKGYDIHHIVPLYNSNLISGRHVPYNLEYMERKKHQQLDHTFKSYIEVI